MKLHENNARQRLLHKKPKPLRSSDAKWSLRFIYSCKTSETLLERYCLLHLTLNPIRTQPCTVPVIISRRQLSAWHPSLTGSVTNGLFRKLICRNKPWLICQWFKCYQFGQAWERLRLTHVACLLNALHFICVTQLTAVDFPGIRWLHDDSLSLERRAR